MTEATLKFYRVETRSHLNLPYADTGIRAGFPSPAQDYLESVIDLNRELIKHPATTFFGRVCGDSMKDAGIHDGDILVIDKSIEPKNGDMAVCFVDGDFTIKYIRLGQGLVWLLPANNAYQPIKVTSENDFMIWGIVTYSIKNHHR